MHELTTARRASQTIFRSGGARKFHRALRPALRKAGVEMGRDRMFEELRQRGLLVPPLPRQWSQTTQYNSSLPVFHNEIKELEIKHANEIWVADMTYVRTDEGFLYVSLITDKYSRKIVGFHADETLETKGALKAIRLRRLGLRIHVFNPERHVWNTEDDKLLGTRPDKQIALFLGTTLKVVLHRRAKYKIPACPQQVAQQRRRWSEHDDHVVRTLPPDQAARQLKRTRENILARRRTLGIRQIVRRAWSAGEDALFTQFNDDEIAQKLGRTLSSVENRRFRLDVPVPKPGWRFFTPEEDALLGTATDVEIAKRLGRNPSSVQARRRAPGRKWLSWKQFLQPTWR